MMLSAEIEPHEWGVLATLATILSVLTAALIKFWPVRARAARETEVARAKVVHDRKEQEARIKKDVYEQVREHYEEVFEQQRKEIEQQRKEIEAQRERTEKVSVRLEKVYAEVANLHQHNADLLVKNERLLARVAVLEATLDRFRTQTAVSNVPTLVDAIIVASDRGTIRQWNDAATVLFHWTSDEVIDRKIDIIIPPEFLDQHRRAWQEVIETGRDVRRGPHQFIAVTKDGERFPVDVLFSSWREGNRRLFSASIRKAITNANGERLSDMQPVKELAAAAASLLEESGVLRQGEAAPHEQKLTVPANSEEVNLGGGSASVAEPDSGEQGGR
jgi:PAS domain S-box-containing protein